jgi:hypothetical protein
MSIVAIGSLRGSPGATTMAVALASVWARRERGALVVEADPDGGVLAARSGLGHHPCLTDLAVRARSGFDRDGIWELAQTLPGGPVIVGHPSADQCHATLRTGAGRLGGLLASIPGHDALVDVGRLRPGSPALGLVEAAALTLLVLRPRLEDVDVAAQRLPSLNTDGNVGIVVVGDRPYGADAVQDALGVAVLGVMPVDVRGAEALGGAAGTGRRPRGLALLRAASALAHDLAVRLDRAEAAPATTEVA